MAIWQKKMNPFTSIDFAKHQKWQLDSIHKEKDQKDFPVLYMKLVRLPSEKITQPYIDFLTAKCIQPEVI